MSTTTYSKAEQVQLDLAYVLISTRYIYVYAMIYGMCINIAWTVQIYINKVHLREISLQQPQ